MLAFLLLGKDGGYPAAQTLLGALLTPVLLAGFSCGTGLIAMCSIALALIAKSVNYLPF